ncbi:MAG: sulfurtransferase TusA family protein [Clostridia bacterium]|nr:sulfurtransferase TusA family protein [Clostridia bacterium]
MIDARGLSCPLPVVLTQKEIKNNHPDKIEIVVDNQCAVENISRFADNNSYSVEVKENGEDFNIVLTKK